MQLFNVNLGFLNFYIENRKMSIFSWNVLIELVVDMIEYVIFLF